MARGDNIFVITLKNNSPSFVDISQLVKLRQLVADVFAKDVIPSSKEFGQVGTSIDPASKVVGPAEVVVYLTWMDPLHKGVVHAVTKHASAIDPNHGGVTSNSGQGVISEVWWNTMLHAADLNDVKWAVVHEIMHNKTDVGSAQLGTDFVYKGKKITDMHSQSGGSVAAKPSRPPMNADDKAMLALALPRLVPQYTGHL
jgi:hypothetical protein